jgi:hypothetical protein
VGASNPSRRGRPRGVRAEILIAATISAGVLGTTMLVATQLQDPYDIRVETAAARREAEAAVATVAQQLRDGAIRRNPDGDDLPDDIRVRRAGPRGAVHHGGHDGGAEDVTIAHDAATRTITRRDNRTGVEAPIVTLPMITNLTFQYLDERHAATTADAAVRLVRVSVTATTRGADPRTANPVSFTVSDEVPVSRR